MSATLVIEYDRVFDPVKDSHWKLLDSSGSFLACLMYTWVSSAIHLLYLKRPVLGLKWSTKVGRLGLHCPYGLQITRISTVLSACQMQVRKTIDVLQRHINLTSYLWKLDNASGFCRVPTLCFHQCTSVDACYSALAAIGSPTNNFCPDSHNMDHLAIREVKLLPARVTAMETESDPRALDALQA